MITVAAQGRNLRGLQSLNLDFDWPRYGEYCIQAQPNESIRLKMKVYHPIYQVGTQSAMKSCNS